MAGRVITVVRDDEAAVAAASFSIKPTATTTASEGGAIVYAQLVFDAGNWDEAQTVYVAAIDDEFVDGGDALVFPTFEDRVNRVRGPLIIDGGVRVGGEQFLTNPLLLPGETNLPIPDGTIGAPGGTATNGNGTIFDVNATHVNAQYGERPGFDPRMNSFPYTVSFLSGPANGQTLDVASISADILSVAGTTAFTVGALTGAAAAAEFSGTPTQSFLSSLTWSRAVVALTGLTRVGEVWKIVLAGQEYSYRVLPGDEVPSRVAQRLAACIVAGITASPDTDCTGAAANGVYQVEVRIGLLGDSRLIITRGGAGFSVTVDIDPAPTAAATSGVLTVSGVPTTIPAATTWTLATWRFTSAGSASIVLGGNPAFSASGADVSALTKALLREIAQNAAFQPLVSGSVVTLQKPWPAPGGGAQLVAGSGDKYVVKPLNLNTRVIETDQVDTINVWNGDSPSDDIGTLTDTSLSGLGMGTGLTLAGRTFAGGITYRNVEALNIELGTGNDTITVESTHAGTTLITSGDGTDSFRVKTIGGHTTVSTGADSDTVLVSNDEGLVDQITALLTIDTGAGNDTVGVDDSADTNDNVGVLTQTTLTGLDMPRVPLVQTIFVKAASGTYKLAKGAGGAQITANVADDAAAMRARLCGLYFGTGPCDLKVAIARSAFDVTYTVTFLRESAIGPFPALLPVCTDGVPEDDDECHETLVPTTDASVEVRTSVAQAGTGAPQRTTVQTLTIDATGGSFVLHFLRPNSDGVLQDVITGPIAWNASVEALLDPLACLTGVDDCELSVLSAALNPNNDEGFRPHTDNLRVSKHGNTFQFFFQGEDRFRGIAWVDVSGLTGGGVRLATRVDGINYYGVETLNVDLGSGHDVFNVQGTSAVTNLDTAAGNDRIYVSSQSRYGLADRPDFVPGHLDLIAAALNIEAGSGRHTLMISDEASGTGDVGVITDVAPSALNSLSPTAEIWVTGLGEPGGISYAATGGTFADGITYWLGSGADVVTVDGTHVRAGVRTITSLNTGLGNDIANVDLDSGEDDFFVLDTQGQAQHRLPIAGGLSAGDHHTPADVVTVTRIVGGVPVPVRSAANTALDTVDLLETLPIGTLVTVTIQRSTVTAFTYDGGFWSLPEVDDEVLVLFVNGEQRAPVLVGSEWRLPAGTPKGALVVTMIVKTLTQTFTTPHTFTLDNDVVNATNSTLPLVIFGGQGDDTINGGTGGDIVFGDRGRVLFFDSATTLPSTAGGIDAALLSTLESLAVVVPGTADRATRPTVSPAGSSGSRSASTRPSAVTTPSPTGSDAIS